MKTGTYHLIIYKSLTISLILTLIYSCKKNETVRIPLLTSTNVSAITETTATSGGIVNSDGGGVVTERGVCWGLTLNPDIMGNKTLNGTGSGSFISTITGLKPGTTYHLRAYATNPVGTGYGNDISFTTLTALPTLTTVEISAKTSSSAISGGNINSDGGGTITARGVCWSTSSNPTISDNKTSDGTGTGPFTSNITGLNPGVTYHARAYSTNSAGTSYGKEVIFTTDALLPELSTTAYSALTATTASSGGTVSSDGGAAVTARGVCWNTSANPTLSNSKTSNGVGIGTYTSNLTGLSPATSYYLRAYATNSAGTAYGNEITFTTPPAVPTLTTSAADLVTTATALTGGMVISDGGATVTDRGVCWSNSPNPTTADFKNSLGAGTVIFSSALSGLTPNTTYYVRAYATNSAGTGYGNEISFITLESVGNVTDADGNVYQTISIGTQMWIKENLKTTKLSDGTPIALVADNTWSTITSPGFGWYNNDAATYKDLFGGYYNWYSVNTGKLCPAGWRVPSDADWATLFGYLGGTSVGGGKMKEAGTAHWASPNTGATNESGFTGLPGGYRFPSDGTTFGGKTQLASWWTTTQPDQSEGFYKQLQWDNTVVSQAGGVKNWGRNVRCVKE